MSKENLPRGIRKRGESYLVDVSSNGIRFTETCATLHEAKAAQYRLKAQALDAIHDGPQSTAAPRKNKTKEPWTLRVGIDRTLSLPAKEGWAGSKGEDTVRLSVEHLPAFFTDGMLLDDIGTDELDAFVADRMEKRDANGTINRKLSMLSKIMRVAEKRGGMVKRPDFPARMQETVGRVRQISTDEYNKLADLFTKWGKPAHVEVLRVLSDTGMRMGELWLIEGRDIDFKTNVLTVAGVDGKGTKNGEIRSVPMTKAVQQVMRDRAVLGATIVFPYSNDWFRNAWDKARAIMGLANDKYFVPHVLRHTCASRLMRGGINLPVVQRWLGHKNIQTTMRYIHLYPSDLLAAVHVLEEEDSKTSTTSAVN